MTGRSVLDAALALAAERDPERLLHTIVDLARELVDADYAALGVRAARGRTLDRFITAGIDAETAARIGDPPIGRGLLGELLDRDEPMRLATLSDHPASVGFPENHPPMERFLGVPLHRGERTLGSIYLTRRADSAEFTVTDQDTVVAMAAHAVVALDRVAEHDEHRRTAQRMAALSTAMRAVSSETDPDQVLRTITDAALSLVDAEFAALGVIGDDGRTFDRFVHAGMDPATVERVGTLPVGLGVLGAVVVEGRPMRLHDIADHPASVGFPDHHPPMTSFIGVPVVTASGRVVGNLYLTNKRGGDDFDDDDEQLLIDLAGQAALAVDAADRLTRERTTVARMSRLLAANLVVSQEDGVEHTLQSFVDVAREVVGAEYAAMGVIDDADDDRGLAAFIHSGIDEETVARIGPLPKGLGVLRAIMVSGRPMRLADLAKHPASVGFPSNHPPMTSLLGVPVVFRGKVLGNLYLTNKIGAAEFSDVDELVASAMAAQSAIAIENARSRERERGLRRELEALDRARSEFISTVTHELKSPLTSLLGFSELLVRKVDELDPGTAQMVEVIGRQAHRLQSIVHALLDLSRIESGRLVVDASDIDVAAAVAEAVDAVPAPEGTTVEICVPTGTTAWGDPSHVDVAVTNYLTNAFRYGGPHVVVGAEVDDGWTTVFVEDDGEGVDPEFAPRLFDRFARHGHHPDSTGLGLAVLRGLIEAMGGRAWHEPRPDGGSRFAFSLPTDRDHAPRESSR